MILDDIARQAMVCGASQNEAELAAALRLIADLGPAVIVEIGCDAGGTLYAWCQICDRVYGITTEDNGYASGGSGKPLISHGAHVIIGNSHDKAVRHQLLGRLGLDQADVLILDGDHHVDAVRQDLAMYGPLVRADGLILIHDINCTSDPRAETHKLWPGLTRQYATSEISYAKSGFGWGIIHVRAGDTFR